MTVRRLHATEAEGWRELRLRALLESPEAFGSRYEDQVVWPLERWRERTEALAESADQAMFVVEGSGSGFQACAGVIEEDEQALVISMWVARQSRGQGLARGLLEAAAEWARSRGHDVLKLHVVKGNHAATELYWAFGFRFSGRVETNENGLEEVEMELPLS